MAITPLPIAPSRTDTTNFSYMADAFLSALPTFATECNAAAVAMSLNATNSTSVTSLTLAIGTIALTVTTAKSYVVGMTVKIASTASPTNWMQGDVTAYTTGTGAMTVNVTVIQGSGTLAAWTISQSSIGGALTGANNDITSLTALGSINGGQLAGFRNRIINGACNVIQRVAFTASGTIAGYGGPDRYWASNSAAGGSFSQLNSTIVGGFNGVNKKTVRQTVNTPPTTLATTSYWSGITQIIEGNNSYDLLGKFVTVSFIFNANVAGVYSVAIRDTGSYSYVSTFVSAGGGVPQKVTISLAAAIPTNALMTPTFANGLYVQVGALNSATYNTAIFNTWQNGTFFSANGAVNWAGSASNFIELSELQLEIGSVATPFEQRTIGKELALCQRYYAVVNGFSCSGYLNATAQSMQCTIPLPVSMAITPTVVITSSGTLTPGWAVSVPYVGLSAFTYQVISTAAGNGGSLNATATISNEIL